MASHDLAHALRRSRSEARVFGEVYDALAADVLRHFTRRTFDVETAADLTAETFARAFESRGRFRASTDADASAWITSASSSWPTWRRCGSGRPRRSPRCRRASARRSASA